MGFRLSEIKLLHLPLHRRMLASRAMMRLLLPLPERIRRILFYGKVHYCPVCESHVRKYMRFGDKVKSWCPVCGSMRWHRFAWVFCQQHTDLFEELPKKMLHVAPEVAFESRLKRILGLDYLTADLQDPHVMVRMDIEDIPFPDDSFDIIFCSHVLEHVVDDRKAMSECVRVLRRGGWALFMVPVRTGVSTDEDPTLVDPAERVRRFRQHDHVRFYGEDIEDRLREAGFEVTVVRANEVIAPDQLERLGVSDGEILFYCRKEAGGTSDR